MLGYLIVGLVLGCICAYIHKQKGYSPVAGFLWGFLFSIIGLIVVLLEKEINPNQKGLSVMQLVLIMVGVGTILIFGFAFIFSM